MATSTGACFALLATMIVLPLSWAMRDVFEAERVLTVGQESQKLIEFTINVKTSTQARRHLLLLDVKIETVEKTCRVNRVLPDGLIAWCNTMSAPSRQVKVGDVITRVNDKAGSAMKIFNELFDSSLPEWNITIQRDEVQETLVCDSVPMDDGYGCYGGDSWLPLGIIGPSDSNCRYVCEQQPVDQAPLCCFYRHDAGCQIRRNAVVQRQPGAGGKAMSCNKRQTGQSSRDYPVVPSQPDYFMTSQGSNVVQFPPVYGWQQVGGDNHPAGQYPQAGHYPHQSVHYPTIPGTWQGGWSYPQTETYLPNVPHASAHAVQSKEEHSRSDQASKDTSCEAFSRDDRQGCFGGNAEWRVLEGIATVASACASMCERAGRGLAKFCCFYDASGRGCHILPGGEVRPLQSRHGYATNCAEHQAKTKPGKRARRKATTTRTTTTTTPRPLRKLRSPKRRNTGAAGERPKDLKACLSTILVLGSRLHSMAMGYYAQTGVLQDSRPVYRSANGYYLFYWSEWKSWRLGTDYRTATAVILSPSLERASCPHDVTAGRWMEYDGVSKSQNFNRAIQVKAQGCPSIIRVSGGTTLQSWRMGVYARTGDIIPIHEDGFQVVRPVYRLLQGSTQFLFYYSVWNVWVIGSDPTTFADNGIQAGRSDQPAPICPHEVPVGNWWEWDGTLVKWTFSQFLMMESQDACAHTDGGKKDGYNNDCSYYDASPSWCGQFDSPDFIANQMCCACGGGRQVCPSNILVNGSTAHPTSMGYYFITGTSVADRPIYYCSESGHYLYYWEAEDNWRIGTNRMREDADVISPLRHGPLCPHDVPGGTWHEFLGRRWSRNSGIKVEPHASSQVPSQAAPQTHVPPVGSQAVPKSVAPQECPPYVVVRGTVLAELHTHLLGHYMMTDMKHEMRPVYQQPYQLGHYLYYDREWNAWIVGPDLDKTSQTFGMCTSRQEEPRMPHEPRMPLCPSQLATEKWIEHDGGENRINGWNENPSIKIETQGCPTTVEVRGQTATNSRVLGQYIMIGLETDTTSMRPVYQSAAQSKQYLYYWPAWNRWIMGPDLDVGSNAFTVSTSNPAGSPALPVCPNRVSAQWMEHDGAVDRTNGWTENPSISVVFIS